MCRVNAKIGKPELIRDIHKQVLPVSVKAHIAFAPIWLFLTEPGQYVLSEFVDAEFPIGVHVDDRIPDDPAARPARFQEIDLFARPGESRSFE